MFNQKIYHYQSNWMERCVFEGWKLIFLSIEIDFCLNKKFIFDQKNFSLEKVIFLKKGFFSLRKSFFALKKVFFPLQKFKNLFKKKSQQKIVTLLIATINSHYTSNLGILILFGIVLVSRKTYDSYVDLIILIVS